jgi:hypothetical protein
MLTGMVTVILLAVVFGSICSSGQAQIYTLFSPANTFNIPETNGSIIFGVNGSYTDAALQNGTWIFTTLHLNNANTSLDTFKASIQNSIVNITLCQKYTVTNVTITLARLRYTVVGNGTQTFNFGLDLKGGDWVVSVNGHFLLENDGWQSSPDGTLIVTGATGSVSISYSIYPSAFGVPDTSKLSFWEQHSVAIVTAAIVAFAVALVLLIRQTGVQRQKKTLSTMTGD